MCYKKRTNDVRPTRIWCVACGKNSFVIDHLCMALLKTPAITLKSRRWGEADRIVTFYTLRFGKVRGVARGARRVKSRFGSALEPFVSSDLNLFEKAQDSLYRVTQADIQESFTELREDLTLMSGGARLVNLVTAITAEGDPCPLIFETLLSGLRVLQGGGDTLLMTLLLQIRLLGQTGFRPETEHCAGCGALFQKARTDSPLWFSPQSGGLVCHACGHRYSGRCLPMSPTSRAMLQHALRWTPAALTRLKATAQVRMELESAMEAYITVVAGKPLPPMDFLAAERHEPAYGF
jgi:DNA repair protein RecO (recombination protein O)